MTEEYVVVADTQYDHLELHYHSATMAHWSAAYLRERGYTITIQAVPTSGSLQT